jgi:hypothetical protein
MWHPFAIERRPHNPISSTLVLVPTFEEMLGAQLQYNSYTTNASFCDTIKKPNRIIIKINRVQNEIK